MAASRIVKQVLKNLAKKNTSPNIPRGQKPRLSEGLEGKGEFNVYGSREIQQLRNIQRILHSVTYARKQETVEVPTEEAQPTEAEVNRQRNIDRLRRNQRRSDQKAKRLARRQDRAARDRTRKEDERKPTPVLPPPPRVPELPPVPDQPGLPAPDELPLPKPPELPKPAPMLPDLPQPLPKKPRTREEEYPSCEELRNFFQELGVPFPGCSALVAEGVKIVGEAE